MVGAAEQLQGVLPQRARVGERLIAGAGVVMLTGSEVSLFTLGFLPGDHVCDEAEQAAYLRELLEVFDAAFVYTFARHDLPHRPRRDDPGADLDLASYGVVRVRDGEGPARDPRGQRYPDLPWEPKAAFDALAAWYAR